jgi:hypothetical protein
MMHLLARLREFEAWARLEAAAATAAWADGLTPAAAVAAVARMAATDGAADGTSR